MSNDKPKPRYHGIDRRAPILPADGRRSGEAFAPPLRGSAKIGGRHAAITTDLYNWHNYKIWADKVRGSWNEKK